MVHVEEYSKKEQIWKTSDSAKYFHWDFSHLSSKLCIYVVLKIKIVNFSKTKWQIHNEGACKEAWV